ncbi:MAG: hypothetical protein LBP85_03370 [Prevotellaceae bacterium]|jgi:hypothetical protein|nr:hypothetical protein [Prevotellaceae bacterium]
MKKVFIILASILLFTSCFEKRPRFHSDSFKAVFYGKVTSTEIRESDGITVSSPDGAYYIADNRKSYIVTIEDSTGNQEKFHVIDFYDYADARKDRELKEEYAQQKRSRKEYKNYINNKKKSQIGQSQMVFIYEKPGSVRGNVKKWRRGKFLSTKKLNNKEKREIYEMLYK